MLEAGIATVLLIAAIIGAIVMEGKLLGPFPTDGERHSWEVDFAIQRSMSAKTQPVSDLRVWPLNVPQISDDPPAGVWS